MEKGKSKTARKVAKRLSMSFFALMCIVSAVAFATDDHRTATDYVLFLGAPFIMSALAYFVVLHHDPGSPE